MRPKRKLFDLLLQILEFLGRQKRYRHLIFQFRVIHHLYKHTVKIKWLLYSENIIHRLDYQASRFFWLSRLVREFMIYGQKRKIIFFRTVYFPFSFIIIIVFQIKTSSLVYLDVNENYHFEGRIPFLLVLFVDKSSLLFFFV